MKIRFLSLLIILTMLPGCRNPFFRDVVGYEEGNETKSSTSTKNKNTEYNDEPSGSADTTNIENPDTTDVTDSGSFEGYVTETITYSESTDLPGHYYIKWKNSGKCKLKNPYLYKNGAWYGYPNNGAITLSEGTYTFYLGLAPSNGGTRISNILTIVVTNSPYE